MAQRGTESILKPPKKRYISNGEFHSETDVLQEENQDTKTRNACSALLELAEICSKSAVRECTDLSYSVADNHSDISTSVSVADMNVSCPALNPPITDLKNALPDSSNNIQNILNGSCNKQNVQQDQPLNLCKNKAKRGYQGVFNKTITASHQQLIDHFVDKFLCEKPAAPTMFYKSEIIDPVLCKLITEKNRCIPSSSRESYSHSAFPLSVAIESAVDNAYSKELNKSSKIPHSNELNCIKNDDNEFIVNFKDQINVSMDVCKLAKSSKQKNTKAENGFRTVCKKKNPDEMPVNADVGFNLHTPSKKVNTNAVPGISKSVGKLMSPPKKSSVWCNLFMNEQRKKNSISVSHSSNLLFTSCRSSQRSCKGKRYKALITEGVLQSPKERKQNKKTLSTKLTSGLNLVAENHVSISSKKKMHLFNQSKPEYFGNHSRKHLNLGSTANTGYQQSSLSSTSASEYPYKTSQSVHLPSH